MSAEIKILIESYSESNLKETNSELEMMLKNLTAISKVKNNKAKEASNTAAISKEIAELKKLQAATEKLKLEVDKVAIAKQKAADAAVVSNNKILASEEKVRQEQIKTAQGALKLAEAEKKVADNAEKNAQKLKKQNDAYGQLSKRHSELRREAMSLAAAYGVESKQAIAAAAAANKLDVQLKKIDASTGVHTRNVGNYASAWSGLNNVMGAFGIILGATAVIGALKESIAAFLEAEKNANALKFAVMQVGKESETSFKSLINQSAELQKISIYSDDDIQKAQTQLVNYGLTSREVEALIPKILDLASATGQDLGSATDTVIKGINGQTKGLKVLGIDYKDTGDKAKNLAILTEQLAKFQGKSNDALETGEGKWENFKNQIGDAAEDVGEFLVTLIELPSALFQNRDATDAWTGSLEELEAETKRINALTAGLVTQMQKEDYEKAKKNGADGLALERMKNAILLSEKQKYADEAKALEDKKLEDDLKRLEDDLAAKKIYFVTELDLTQSQQIEILKAELAARKKGALGDDEDGAGNGGGSGNKKEKEKEKEKLEGRTKEQKRYYAQQNKDNQHRVDRDREMNAEQLALMSEHDQHRLEMYNADRDAKIKAWQEAHDKQKQLTKEEAEERMIAQQQMIADVEDLGEKVLQAAQEKSERELKVIQEGITKQESMVDIQRRRAEQGLTNTLAFEEKKKAEMERAAIAEQKKQQKLKQAEAYWALLATYAKSDGDQAAQKAALEIAEGIAISAAFAEKGGIGEDLKEKTTLVNGSFDRTHGNGNDMLTMISPKEGILTEQNIAALGGKDGFYDLKYNLEKMGSNPLSDDLFAKQNDSFTGIALKPVGISTKPLEQKLDEVVNAVKGIVQNDYNINSIGELIHKMKKANSTVITNKGSFVSPRRNKYIN